jgi:hypothetical protein
MILIYLYYLSFENMISASLIFTVETFFMLLSLYFNFISNFDMIGCSVFLQWVRNVIRPVEFRNNVLGFYDFSGPLEAYSRFICRGSHGSMMRSYNYSLAYNYILLRIFYYTRHREYNYNNPIYK